MRIACLQFAPQVGDVDNNLNRADAILYRANPKNLDLLVLPELAFSGYNFRSLQHISPFLEPTAAGITSLWARTTALRYECVVTAGYPEKVDIRSKWPSGPEYYNSAITISPNGETLANYRKSFLYYTDETWALEGPGGFFGEPIEGLGNVAMGICMDLNPYKFEAPWNAWEFAYHVLHKQANLVILSMAWLTREDPGTYSRNPNDPDMETLAYWLGRLEPLIRGESEGEIIVVLANRCGTEDEAVYAGTSAVIGIEEGEVKVYGILGRGEKELLVADTSRRPMAKLVSEPNSAASTATATTEQSDHTAASAGTALTSPTVDGNFEYSDKEEPPYSPCSPTDPISPHSFFNHEDSALSPTYSPASDTREHETAEPNLIQVVQDEELPDSPTYERPDSPEPRSTSQGPRPDDHFSPHSLTPDQIEQRTTRPLPQSVSAAPDLAQHEAKDSSIGAKSHHSSTRPKSTIW